MRQSEWRLQEDVAIGISLGNVYIFAMQSMLEWWTLSEDRNDMSDLQRNLHWPMFLLNVAFFLGCFGIAEMEGHKERVDGLEVAHREVRTEGVKVAENVAGFLRSM